MSPKVLAKVVRGETVESIHSGHIVVLDGNGNVVLSEGDPDFVTYFRSAAKPFQAIPFILSGAAEHFGFAESEIALACSSHSGESFHTAKATEMLSKAGLNESDLRCGPQLPFHEETAHTMIRKNEKPDQIHNNCSGKHAAMLAFAKHVGADLKTYEQLPNPIQQTILQTVSQFTEISTNDIAIGIDGCAAANFALPISGMALAFAKLIRPPKTFSSELQNACKRIVSAYVNYPELIGGTGRLDTILMSTAGGKIISKVGAEGLWLCGVLPCEKWPDGLGIALKIEDGEDNRARPTVAIELLRRLEVLAADDLKHLSPMPILNRRGDVVGEVQADSG